MKTLRDALTYVPAELAFGTSGLRGLAVDMTDLECYINATGFLCYLAELGELKPGATIIIAGDLRDSTPRITRSIVRAIYDAGYSVVYCGLIPTPTLANYSMAQAAPGIMVTGSHIPADRNGIKFFKAAGEVLKADEPAIKSAVKTVRDSLYSQAAAASSFDDNGSLKEAPELPAAESAAAERYLERYTSVFAADALAGHKLVFYQHSAVGRDLLPKLFELLGAEVVTVGRATTFIPIDTENVTPDEQAYFKQLAADYPDAFAIVSTDGDSDRPFVIDEYGVFHRGDVLGLVVAKWLDADFAAYPITTSDAVDTELTRLGVPFVHTKIGSPYVIAAMAQANYATRPVGWEVNGGFLIGRDLVIGGKTLGALATRDAFVAILGALLSATSANITVAELFDRLPRRFTQASEIDNFTFKDEDAKVLHKLGDFTLISGLDGLRFTFDNGDIVHLRPSGNAPQLRVYSVADTQSRADEIVSLVITALKDLPAA